MILLKKLKVRLLFLTVLSSLCFISIAQDAEEGEQIFRDRCISCHNLPGGGKLIGPDLQDVLTHDRFVNEEDQVGTLIKYVQNPSDFGGFAKKYIKLVLTSTNNIINTSTLLVL